MAGLKVTLLSFLERAAALAEQLPNPLLLLPAWLRSTIVTTAKFIFALASVVALVLYRNQVRARRAPAAPGARAHCPWHAAAIAAAEGC